VIGSLITTMEILLTEPLSFRAKQVLAAMDSAGFDAAYRVTAGRQFQGESDLLVVWGPGHPTRFEPMRQQLARGGHVLALDLAYWHRERKVRISIDGAHPAKWVMRKSLSPARWNADRMRVENQWNPDGPVLIAGLGDKARVQYGALTVDRWEAEMMAECTRRGRSYAYRPKPRGASVPIELALRGVSLVITWHSNVAVDAIRLGIPVICRDGAAAAVCPDTWQPEHRPLPKDVRDQFLANLAWFQWDLSTEAAACLAFVQELLS